MDSKQEQYQDSVNDVFAQLRELCVEEDYALELPERTDRKEAFYCLK